MKYLSLTGLTTYDTKIKEYITNGLNGKTDKADVGYIELTSSSESVTDAQLAEALKKYCIIKYTFGNEEYIYYKLDENSTRIRFGREIKTVTYISYSELFQPSLEISKNTKSVQASNIFGISLYNKSQNDTLLNSKLSTNQVAVVEDSTTASKAYAVGDLLIYNGTLYKVTSAISSRGTIIVGTNVIAITIEGLLSDKQDKSNIRTSWQSTPDNTHYPSEKLVKDNLDNKSDKSATVSTVSYDTANKKLTKTINGTTTDVVSIATLKSDIDSLNDRYVRYDTNAQGLSSTQKTNAKTNLDLNNVTNDKQIKGLSSGTTENHILVFGTDGYTAKDSGKSVQDIVNIAEGKTKTIITNTTQMASLKVQTATVTVSSLKDKDGNTVALSTLHLGDNVLLTDLEYPDRWVSTITTSGSTVQSVELSILETQKVDLSGYQTLIDSSNKLSSDLVDDTNKTNKFVTSTEKTTWNNKQDKSNIRTSWQSTPDDTHYPSEKLVKDNLDNKSDKSATVSTVSYDTTNKKLTKTINGSTTEIVKTSKLKEDIDSLNDRYVRYDTNSQGLTTTQQTNSRTNIDALGKSENAVSAKQLSILFTKSSEVETATGYYKIATLTHNSWDYCSFTMLANESYASPKFNTIFDVRCADNANSLNSFAFHVIAGDDISSRLTYLSTVDGNGYITKIEIYMLCERFHHPNFYLIATKPSSRMLSINTTNWGATPDKASGTTMTGNAENVIVASNSYKLNGQEASYYLNYNNLSNKPTIPTLQNNFGIIKIGSTNVEADSTRDTLELAGSNVTLTPDATNDKIIIGITQSNVTTALGYTPFDSTNIGYVELNAADFNPTTHTVSITSAQALEMQKKYCIVIIVSPDGTGTLSYALYKSQCATEGSTSIITFETLPDINSSNNGNDFSVSTVSGLANTNALTFLISNTSFDGFKKSYITNSLDGKQPNIDSSHKLSADLVSSGSTNMLYQTKTGAQLEDGGYTTGQIYYCSASSDSFTQGKLYMATGANSIVLFSSSAINITPEILSFSISPTSTELGNKVSVTYSYTLKKYGMFTGLTISNGTTTYPLTPSASVTDASISGTYDSATFTLSGTATGTTIASKSKSITASYRYFFTGTTQTNVSTVLTSLKDVQTTTATTQTSLSKPSKVNLTLGSTNQYVYFVVPSTTSINTVKSGGFDVPFSQIGTTYTFTNHYNATYSVKVYRTDLIKGTINFDIT